MAHVKQFGNINSQNITFQEPKNHITNILCDREWLTKEDLSENLTSTNTKCPQIEIKLNNIKIKTLIDTGSTVNCINEDYFENNQNLLKPFEIFPLTNIKITTALGQKSTRVKKMILIKTTVLNKEKYLQFLIIPALVQEIILGNEGLMTLGMVINFDKEIIYLNNNSMNHIGLNLRHNSSSNIQANEGVYYGLKDGKNDFQANEGVNHEKQDSINVNLLKFEMSDTAGKDYYKLTLDETEETNYEHVINNI